MRPTRMKMRQWLFTACVGFYVANHMFLPSAAAGITSARSSGVFNTPVPSVVEPTLLLVDTTPTPFFENTPQGILTAIPDDLHVGVNSTHNASVSPTVMSNETSVDLGDEITPDKYSLELYDKTKVLVQGMASMRLKSNDMEGINTAISVWYTYCEEYLKTRFEQAGFNNSELLHAYDWVQIDDLTLDVFFVGKIIENSEIFSNSTSHALITTSMNYLNMTIYRTQ